MNARSLRRTAVTTSLRLARVPLDTAIRALPERAATNATLAVDRADATARSVAGTVIFDPELREDARRRRAATRERERAAALRAEANNATVTAESRVEERGEQAQHRRTEADRQAARRRSEAKKEADRKRNQAADAERRRKAASRNVEDRVEAEIQAAVPEKRLDALQARAEAEEQREEALTAADEAQRLGEAAAAVKDERTQD